MSINKFDREKMKVCSGVFCERVMESDLSVELAERCTVLGSSVGRNLPAVNDLLVYFAMDLVISNHVAQTPFHVFTALTDLAQEDGEEQEAC